MYILGEGEMEEVSEPQKVNVYLKWNWVDKKLGRILFWYYKVVMIVNLYLSPNMFQTLIEHFKTCSI